MEVTHLLYERTRLLRRFIPFVTILICWEIIAEINNEPLLIPWPSYILTVSLPSVAIFDSGRFPNTAVALLLIFDHLLITLHRLIIGLVLGICFGLLLGLSMHYFGRVRRSSALLLTIVRSFPLFSLIPLFIFWFSGKELAIYLYISFAVFLVVTTGVFEAVFNVPTKLLIQSRLLGATRRQSFYNVTINSILPEIIGSIRNVVGLSWAFSLGAEYLSAQDGLGYLVYLSYLYADMGKLLVFACVYGACGFVCYKIMNMVSSYIKRWAV